MKALLKKLMFLSLMMCVLSAWADDMPIGKKVKIHTKNGGIQEGVLKSADQEKAVLSVGKEDKTFMFSDVEKVVVSSNQLPVKLENEKEAKKGNNAMHRITPIALSFGDSSYGAEICGYEFISKGGFATRVTPLSFYFSTRDETVTTTRTSWGGGTYTYTGTYTDESFYWTPVWFRYYARKSSPAFWPYVGGTLAMHGFDDDEPTQLSDVEVEYTLRPAADFGFSFGGRVVRGDLGGKLFVGTGGDDKSLFMFNAGLSIGWGGDKMIKKSLSVILSSALLLVGSPWRVMGEESSNPETPKVEAEGQLEWKNRVQELKVQRNSLYVLGIGGTVAGIALISSGISDNQSAKDTPGCSQSGTTVYCQDAETTAQAQEKIDEGDKKMATGSIVAIAGAGLIVWGAFRGSKAKKLQREGERKGYSLSVLPKRDGMDLVLNKSF